MVKLPDISNIQYVPVPPENGLIGFVSFVVDDKFKFGDIAVYTKPNGSYSLAYPTRTLKNGRTITIARPITAELENFISSSVSIFLENLLKKKGRGR